MPPDCTPAFVARAGLETLSRERVRMELLKLLLAPHATPTLAVMAETGILGAVLGGVPLLASFENMVKVEAAMGLARRRRAPIGRARRHGEGRRRTARAAASSCRTRKPNGCVALEHWWRVSPQSGDQPAHALLYRLGPQSFADRVLLAWSRSAAGAADRAWHELGQSAAALDGAEFSAEGRRFHPIAALPPGPALGAAMRAAEEAWIAADFPADRAALEAIADRAAREVAATG